MLVIPCEITECVEEKKFLLHEPAVAIVDLNIRFIRNLALWETLNEVKGHELS